jgi:hypothetical protein
VIAEGETEKEKGETMKRKMKWVALGIVVGVPVAFGIVGAVEAAMCNDWSGVMFIGALLWAVLVSILVGDLLVPNKAVKDSQKTEQGKGEQ